MNNKVIEFPCGCKFNLDSNHHVIFDPDIENINLDCQKTWKLIGSGNTKGVFQLESRLGRSIAKKLKPENIEHLSALLSIVRPGCISGDTNILINKYIQPDGKIIHTKHKIRKMYKNKKYYIGKQILSYDETTGKLVKNTIKNIVYNGTKECFNVKVITTNPNIRRQKKYPYYDNLECTEDHRLLTSRGWKELKDIKIGDRILAMRKKNKPKPMIKKFVSSRHSPDLKIKNVEGLKSYYLRCHDKYEYRCVMCDWMKGSLDINHIEGNRHTDNSVENLCYLCPNHHREYTEGNISKYELLANRKKHILPYTEDGKWVTVVEKDSIGEKDVYDITMDTPHHNFIAGNIIVHNCLEAIRDNKSVTQHYIDRKNGEESVDYYHSALEPILKDTYGEMIYQEQAMAISGEIAGFNTQKKERLRKIIGKKQVEEMAKLKQEFLDGCTETNIVTKEEGENIFDWISKSGRYLFNKSHSVSYSLNSYLSAYAKAHFPKMFFKAYLKFARDKIDPHAEIKGLYQNATEMDITVRLPDLRLMNEYFFIHEEDIYFGLRDIKSLGDSVYKKLIKIKDKLDKPFGDLSWIETLFLVLNNINSTAAKAIIECGAISYINKSRSSMLFEFQLISDLSGGELKFCQSNLHYKNLGELLRALLDSGKVQTKRLSAVQDKLKLFKNPPYSLSDTIDWLSDAEYNILGTSVSCSKVDAYDISMTNVTCKELKTANQNPITSIFANKNVVIGGEIENINVTKTKKGKTAGQEMAFLEISDNTGVLDNIIVFPDTYKQYRQALFAGNIVVIMGNRSQKGDSLIVDKVYVAKT